VRKSTFWNWKNKYVGGADLAKAGFVCLHEADLVQCFFCRVIVGFWEEGDIPIKEHTKHNPSCPFVQGQAYGNVSEDGSEAERALSAVVRRALTDCQDPPTASLRLATDSVASLPARLRSEEECFMSFLNAKGSFPPAKKMAAAGFFYLGISDMAVCSACGGGVLNWEAADDPVERHTLLYPSCPASRDDTEGSYTTSCSRTLPKDFDRDLILKTRIGQELLKMGFNNELVKGALCKQMEENLFLPGELGYAIELVYDHEDAA